MKAMILAAGFGTRLFPLTIDRTKPAIPFLGKPLVGYVAEYVAKFGFRDVVVNLHHQPESVKNALGDGADYGVKIHYTLETPKILGTAVAWRSTKPPLGSFQAARPASRGIWCATWPRLWQGPGMSLSL